MLAQLDNWLPWFGDMLELGGHVLLLIIALAVVIWALVLERVVFLCFQYPHQLNIARALWAERKEHCSWYAHQARNLILCRLKHQLNRNQQLMATLIKVSPLLGLLGTVLGMLEIFDALAVTGSNSARTTAGGVSKATVSTMAGMVVAISGLMACTLLNKRIESVRNQLRQTIEMD